MCLQGRLAHLLTAWGGDTLLLSSKVRVGVGVRVGSGRKETKEFHTTASRNT
jgi:hypothetical protein